MKGYGLEGSEQMEQVWGLYIGTVFYIEEKLWSEVVNLWNVFHHKVFSVSFVIDEKNYCDEKPIHLFWTP